MPLRSDRDRNSLLYLIVQSADRADVTAAFLVSKPAEEPIHSEQVQTPYRLEELKMKENSPFGARDRNRTGTPPLG